jgi:hypothetical protein
MNADEVVNVVLVGIAILFAIGSVLMVVDVAAEAIKYGRGK